MQLNPDIHPSEINEQLLRVLEYGVFRKSPILSRFLTFVVGEYLAGRANSLKEYTIGLEVLGKPATFDQQTDAVVRIHAVRLRKAISEYYQGPGTKDKLIIEIPKGAYVPAFSRRIKTNGALSEKSDQRTVLAIYPFLIAEKNLIGFGDGLCEALCNEFSMRPELSTISYYSSRLIADQEKEMDRACELLGSDYLLTGYIQLSGYHMRIGVQLIQCKTQHQVWGKTFDIELQELEKLDLLDQIVLQTVNRIAGAHGVIIREKSKSVKKSPHIAINDVLYWYYRLVSISDKENLIEAKNGVKKALDHDASYALGWAILSEIYVASHFYGYAIGEESVLKRAVECGKTALSLDLGCDHAYQSLGLAYLFLHKRKECEGMIRDWQRLDSKSALTAGGLGFCLTCIGDLDEGLAMLEQSIKLNPYYPWWFNAAFAIYHYMSGDYEEAIYWTDKIGVGSMLWENFLKSLCLAELGSSDDLAHTCRHLEELSPGFWENADSLARTFILSERILEKMKQSIDKAKAAFG
jgi:TolB-like protein